MSIPTTRPSGTSFASRRESHPAPQPTSRTLSVGASRIFSSTGSVMGRCSCSIPSPRPASAQRLNSSRRESFESRCISEGEQVARNQLLRDWVYHKAQNFESCRSKDCFFPSSSTNFCLRSDWSWPDSASAICVIFIEQNFGPHIEQNFASL